MFNRLILFIDSGTFLTVTTPSPSDQISINDVKIVGSPVFDDGSLIVFGIEDFFDPNFTIPNTPVPVSTFDHCTASFRDNNNNNNHNNNNNNNFSFHDSANVLVSRGYSVIASFLNLQLLGLGFATQPRLTVFAPSDEVMIEYSGRFPDYQSLFYRHVLPCKISWRDLINVEDGTGFDTYLGGFEVRIFRSGGTFKVNEVPITFPDMYYSEWIVVHGIREALSVPKPVDEVGDGDGDPFEDDGSPAKPEGRELSGSGSGSGSDRSEF